MDAAAPPNQTTEAGANPPNHTIYIRNIDEKIKINDLKVLLKQQFSQFGNVLDVVALKTVKMRGQAFVVFDNTDSATKALQEMQGRLLQSQAMVLIVIKKHKQFISIEHNMIFSFP
eukprot:c12818_g1_i1.p1 GENE.c12818_g1_i1~~c12818_g1_i1.p1  ORF type:complete len:116 (-),score=21.47 c12818_g1_i1:495-842(-)